MAGIGPGPHCCMLLADLGAKKYDIVFFVVQPVRSRRHIYPCSPCAQICQHGFRSPEDLGASVIRCEPPGGRSGLQDQRFVVPNRSRKSIIVAPTPAPELGPVQALVRKEPVRFDSFRFRNFRKLIGSVRFGSEI